MSFELQTSETDAVITVRVSGKLTHADYEKFEAAFELRRELYGKLRVLFEMVDFHGWENGVFWEDVKFDARHYGDVERFAMVGDRKWEKNLTTLAKPFTAAEVRYFDLSQRDEAHRWIIEGVMAHA
ncbi:MAG TPA: STAS/SEC14 domain-containing protein [Opitutaceae bacterium]|nr:STAS/SEC14 domain-containing protein [Opitutaceae bacterium]